MKNPLAFSTIMGLISFFAICCQTMKSDPKAISNEPYSLNRPFAISADDIIGYNDLHSNFASTKSENKRVVSIDPIIYSEDTLMFLVNYSNDWEVLSADIRAPRVLISGTGGQMSIDSLYAVPSQSYFMDQLAIALSGLVTNSNNTIEESFFTEDNWHDIVSAEHNTREWSDWHLYRVEYLNSFVTIEDGHLTTTEWGQSSKWNSMMPTKSTGIGHCPSGCVAVATAQMLYFLYEKFGFAPPIYGESQTTAQPPTDSTGIYLDSSNTTFIASSLSSSYWSELPKSLSDPVEPELFDAVSSLMLYLGFYLPSCYHDNNTSAPMLGIKTTFSSIFGVSSKYTSPVNFDVIRNQIHYRGVPCIVSIGNADGGHAVIIDGFKRITTLLRKYYVRNDTNGNTQYMTTIEPLYSDFVCINWGWSGTYNNDPVWYNVSSSWHGYSAFNQYIYDIYSDEE